MAHNRFLFDADFSHPNIPDKQPDDRVSNSHSEIYQSGYDSGYADGIAASQKTYDENLVKLLQNINHAVQKLYRDNAVRKSELEDLIFQAIANLVRRFGSKIDPADILTQDQFGFSALLSTLENETELKLKAAPGTLDALEALFMKTDRELQISRIPTKDRPEFDFELNWKDGGMVYAQDALKRRLDAVIDQHHKPKISAAHDDKKESRHV